MKAFRLPLFISAFFLISSNVFAAEKFDFYCSQYEHRTPEFCKRINQMQIKSCDEVAGVVSGLYIKEFTNIAPNFVSYEDVQKVYANDDIAYDGRAAHFSVRLRNKASYNPYAKLFISARNGENGCELIKAVKATSNF